MNTNQDSAAIPMQSSTTLTMLKSRPANELMTISATIAAASPNGRTSRPKATTASDHHDQRPEREAILVGRLAADFQALERDGAAEQRERDAEQDGVVAGTDVADGAERIIGRPDHRRDPDRDEQEPGENVAWIADAGAERPGRRPLDAALQIGTSIA